MTKRSKSDRLAWIALALVPSWSLAHLLHSGVTPRRIAVWLLLVAGYLLVLGELYHRKAERRHVSAIVFALLASVMNLFALVLVVVLLLFNMKMGP